MSRQMLPGFLLTIEDNAPATESVVAVKDVYMIYGVLPETLAYEDEDGNMYDKYIEPNTPLLITSQDEAIKTLEASDIALTREIKNMLSLMPTGVNIALCRLVNRDGSTVDTSDLTAFYEALNFAFEETENYPIKEIYVAGLSLDKSLELKGNQFTKSKLESLFTFESETLLEAVEGIASASGSTTLATSKSATITAKLERSVTSEAVAEDNGIYDMFTLYVNGKVAKIAKDGVVEEARIVAEVDYSNIETPVITEVTKPSLLSAATFAEVDGKINVELNEQIALVIDEESVVTLNAVSFTSDTIGVEGRTLEASVYAVKTSANACILTRILEHNQVITATQNPCLTFLSPEPPRNQSKKAIEEYVERCLSLKEKIREKAVTTKNGRKVDLGMYLSVPVGVNMLDGKGGLFGHPQATISTVADNKIITKKVTTAFSVGDVVEVYSHDKLDILSVKAKVVGVRISDIGTTEIELDIPTVPGSIMVTRTPKYIMNVNNKDENGNLLAIQYSNICKQVGVRRSPAGVAWPGECQVAFSEKQKDKLNAAKFCVVSQKVGTTQGEVDKSQLMTGTQSQFQDFENIVTIYDLVAGSKTIGLKYKGERIQDGQGVAIIKTEIEDSVFKPRVGVSIYAGYELTLSTRHLTNSNGKKEKALFIDFTVREIETMKLLRMTARLA